MRTFCLLYFSIWKPIGTPEERSRGADAQADAPLPMWNHWVPPHIWNPIQTSQTKLRQNSAGSSFKLCRCFYSLRMMSMARGGLSRQLGSIVKLVWLFMLAAGGLSFPPPNKRCSARRPLLCRFSPAEWQELLSAPRLCTDWRMVCRGFRQDGRQRSSPPFHTPPKTLVATPPRTRLGPAVIGRAGSPANHSPVGRPGDSVRWLSSQIVSFSICVAIVLLCKWVKQMIFMTRTARC